LDLRLSLFSPPLFLLSSLHKEAKVLVSEDIEAFFNSTLIKCPENEKKDRNITSMKISTSKLLSSK